MSRVEFKNNKIYVDASPVQIISGAIHYWRVPEALWEDRIYKAAQMGLNCIETYIPWNRIEPEDGCFKQEALDEIVRFTQAIQKAGLYAILRPGPYICAEYDNGSLPYWLMNRRGIKVRRMNAPYLDALKPYLDVLLPVLKQLQYDCGGPVLTMQVENEYGSYSHDADYINWIKQRFLENGITVPLFTADGNDLYFINHGSVDGLTAFMTGGSRLKDSFSMLSTVRPDDPPAFMEFWCGWFVYWGNPPIVPRQPEEIAQELDDALSAGGHVNIYMFHGGSNFGYTAGANIFEGRYTPDTSSYDYFAPLNEQGNPTPLYYAFQKVICKYRPDFVPQAITPSAVVAFASAPIARKAPLLKNLEAVGKSYSQVSPETMEAMNQANGFALYRSRLTIPMENTTLDFYGMHDRAQVFLNGAQRAVLFRNDPKTFRNGLEHPCLVVPDITIPKKGLDIDILVEAFGHVNYGADTARDFKGLTDEVCINGMNIHINWQTWSLPLAEEPMSVTWEQANDDSLEGPAFYQSEFTIDSPADTFLKFPGICGQVWINGFLLGRYWDIGPDTNLYIPAPLLQKGTNRITIFETEKLYSRSLTFETRD